MLFSSAVTNNTCTTLEVVQAQASFRDAVTARDEAWLSRSFGATARNSHYLTCCLCDIAIICGSTLWKVTTGEKGFRNSVHSIGLHERCGPGALVFGYAEEVAKPLEAV